ncbi:recombinase family protein [Streptomyces sp. NPDC050263]|uniref:recombinase family protein n=1 Tax=Streptomyces sp. NPDC050263 TaxID=3155037 RepID=UPI00342D275D
MGYARCSTAQQELQSQLDSLAEAGCDPVFSEKISTRIKVRPEFVKAMDFARTIKEAVPHQRVICTVHEMKRLGRGAAELLAIAEDLRHHDIELELLTGPLQGVCDPSGHGAALFAFFAGMAESEREYIREKSLEGQASARERGRHGRRPKVVDNDMADYARALRAQGVPVPQIANKLVIPSGKNKGEHPRSPLSTASSPKPTATPTSELVGQSGLQDHLIAPLPRISEPSRIASDANWMRIVLCWPGRHGKVADQRIAPLSHAR